MNWDGYVIRCGPDDYVDKGLYHYNRMNEGSLTSRHRPESIANRFTVKYEIDRAEKNGELRRKNQHTILKDYEVVELFTSRYITPEQFRHYFLTFLLTLWQRKKLNLKWKRLVLSMFLGVGSYIRKYYFGVRPKWNTN